MSIRSARMLAVAGLAIGATNQAAAQAVTWDGDCGTFWLATCGAGNSTTSWDNDMFPGPTDDVTINGATVSMNTDEDVNTFNLNGGGLSIGGARTLTMNNGGSASGATILGRFKTFGTYTFAGSNTFSGEIYGPGMYVNSGMVTLSGISIGDIVGTPTTFRNEGTVNLPFAPDVRAGSEFINSGTINLPSEIRGQGRFENNGDIVVPQPQSAFIVIGDFRMLGGTVTVDQSQLAFGNEARYSGGTMTANAGGLIRFGGTGINHTFEGLSEFNGEGVINIATGGFAGHRFEAPLTFNMTGDGQAQVSGFGFVSAEITNTGNILFAGERFEQGGGGSFVNEAGGTMEIALNTAGQLATDIPIINRGYAKSLSAVGINTFGVNPEVTNEAGGIWDMFATPGADVFFRNFGTVYRRDVDGRTLENGAFQDVYDQTNALTQLEGALTTFSGSGTWTDSTLRMLSPGSALVGSTSGTYSFDGDNRVEYTLGSDGELNGRFTLTNGPTLAVSGTLTFSGPQDGPGIGEEAEVTIGGSMLGEGTIINEGDMKLFTVWKLGGTIGGGTFRNDGRMLIEASSAPAPQITMDFENNGQIRQTSIINAAIGTITNAGEWEINGNARIDGPTTLTNTGEIKAITVLSNPAQIGPTITLDNQGVVRVRQISQLRITGPIVQLTNGMLTGGTWIVETGGELIFPAGTLLTKIAPGATVAGSTDAIPDTETLDTVEGTLDGRGPLRVIGGLDIENGGEIIVRPPESLLDSLDVQSEFRNNLFGGGNRGPTPGPTPRSTLTLTNTRADGSAVPDACMNPITISAASFVNEDLIVVGPAGEIVAAEIAAPVTLAPTSTIRVDIAGPTACTEHDQLRVTGAVSSGGTIEVTLQKGYVPQALDTFRVITAIGGVSGQVPTVVTTNPVPGVRLVGSFDVDAVQVMAFCAADTNLDGSVTPADFNSWIIAFNTQSDVCDQNADGLCTPADFNAWILNFNTGCP